MKKFFALTFILVLAASGAHASVAINEANFPDASFRTSVTIFDLNGDEILSDSEIALADTINVSRTNVRSLQGIEYFTSLKTLYCDRNNIDALDLSRNTNLETLFCTNSSLTSLNLTNCTRLKELYCYQNKLEGLNLSNMPYLVSLDCQENRLKNLDVSKNLMLEFLDCSANDVTSLNVSENTNLKNLYCRDLNLASGVLDVSKNPQLTRLWCWNDGLTSINFADGLALHSLRADSNNLTSLAALDKTHLSELALSGNSRLTDSGTIRALTNMFTSGDTATLDVGDYDNVIASSIRGYNASGESLSLLSFVDGAATFSSRPEVVTYNYDTGLQNLSLASVASRAGSNLDELLSVCSNGIFSGTYSDGVTMWKGVPYAKSPTGSRRWKAPEAPDNSFEVFSAQSFGPAALQPDSDYPNMSEDCLYLNVWNAGGKTGLKPVVVWIHGGSFRTGATSYEAYQGENFARENPDIVFVSIGYRLGIMGFIDFSNVSGGAAYPDATNLGLLDMMQALRWLNANIASFGGDPNRVTLMGQSSGSACISMLMTIPESRNYFQRAILESGTLSMHTRKADALPLAQKLLAATGKTDMNGLTSLTQSELIDAIDALGSSTNFPENDGRILSEDLYAAFALNAGNFDMIIGSDAEEINYWRIFMTQESFDQMTTYGFLMTEAAISHYSSDDVYRMEEFAAMTSDDYTEFFNDLLFRAPAIQLAQSHTGRSYMYYWEYPAQLFDALGAYHGSELPYFVNNPALANPLVLAPDSGVMSRVQPLITSFIKTGIPSNGSTTWPEYNASTRTTMIFNERGNTELYNAPLDEQRALVMPLLKWGISGREFVNGDLSEGISIDPDAAPKPDPTPTPDPDPENPDNRPRYVGSSGGGCDAGVSLMGILALAFFVTRKEN